MRFSQSRKVAPLFLAVALFLPGLAAAGPPTSRPSPQGSPQRWLDDLSDGRLAKMTAEQAMSLYSTSTPPELEMARLMAQQTVATATLEESARAKWGNGTATAVAHLCADNTPEDNAQATWTINGNHAVARFKAEGMAPVVLIQIQGGWKIDVASYITGLGEQLPAGLRFMKASIDVLKRLNEDLKRGAFATSDDLIRQLKDAMDKLNAAN